MKYPQGFELLVDDPEQELPVRLQLTEFCVVFLNVAVNVIVPPTGASSTGEMLPVAPVTVMPGQLDPVQGPLPPLAQPLARARLNKAAANRKFFIIGSLLECAGKALFPEPDLGRLATPTRQNRVRWGARCPLEQSEGQPGISISGYKCT